MAQLHEYECPKCGGALEFNSAIQKLKCPYCDSEYEISEFEAVDSALDQTENEQDSVDHADGADSEDSASGLVSYVCKSCGGEIVGDSTLASSACPFCGNPVVMMGQLSGSLKPDYIIPFKLDKKAAKEALKKHLEGKKLLPKVFKNENHIDEIKGLYVPFWFFDTDVYADIVFKADKTSLREDNENSYRDVAHYSLSRKGNMSFENVPVDASQAMDDALMESIEPYDFADAKKFSTAYLAGYAADKFDIESSSCLPRAKDRISLSVAGAVKNSITGYENVTLENADFEYSDTFAKYALCPVWLLNTSWNNEKFTFAMNGQTGRFVGNLPVDKGALKKYFFTVAGISALIVYLFINFFLG